MHQHRTARLGKLALLVGLVLWTWTGLQSALHAQGPSGALPDWSQAGLSETPPALLGERQALDFGAIPNDGLDDAAAIQAALDDLNGMPGLVLLGPGRYRIEQAIDLPSGAVLRGMGADSTRLEVDFAGGGDDAIRIWSPEEGVAHALPGHPAFGERGIALPIGDPVSELQPGDWMELWQDNGAWDSSPASWAAESTGHIARVQSRTTDSLLLTAAIPSRFDTAMVLYLRRIEPARFAGVECLAMERMDNASAGSLIQCYLAVDCWMQGLSMQRSAGAHILAARSAHLWISGSVFEEAWAYDGAATRGYGVALVRHTVFSLVEDNVFRRLRHAMILKQGSAGNVYAYNYSLEPKRSEPIPDFSGDISLHGHWAQGNLFEGNDVANIITDDYWGPSGPGNALYRNRARLYGIINSSAATAEQAYAGNMVTGSGLLLGQYVVLGSGHTEFGNWVGGTVEPAGSAISGPPSLYRDAAPDWWDGPDPWPALGFGQEGTLPARARYEAGRPSICRSAACLPPDTLLPLPVPAGYAGFTWTPVPEATAYQWRARPLSGAWVEGRTEDSLWLRPLPAGAYRFQIRPECGWRIGPPSPQSKAVLSAFRGQAQSGDLAQTAVQQHAWMLLSPLGRVLEVGQAGQALPPKSLWTGSRSDGTGPGRAVPGARWLWQKGRLYAW